MERFECCMRMICLEEYEEVVQLMCWGSGDKDETGIIRNSKKSDMT